jgi:hypothetical protein
MHSNAAEQARRREGRVYGGIGRQSQQRRPPDERAEQDLMVIMAAMARMDDVMHAMADVAARGGDGVAAGSTDVHDRVPRGATGLGDGMADAAARVLGGVDRIGEGRARDSDGNEQRQGEGFHKWLLER